MTLIKCPSCQREVSTNAQVCPGCGEPLVAKKAASRTGSIVALALLLVAVIGFGLGKFHVITGGRVGFEVVPRNGFGYSEIFINVDEITHMPYLAAKTRFPIGCAVLQREGIIESDADFQRRIEQETAEKVRKMQAAMGQQ